MPLNAMPELPEVETTRRGLEPHILGKRIIGVVLRRDNLRWPIPFDIVEQLPGRKITGIERRAKYLLMHTEAGSALWHLGMSGSMRVLKAGTSAGKHDHVDIELSGQRLIRFTDPRRFGVGLGFCAPRGLLFGLCCCDALGLFDGGLKHEGEEIIAAFPLKNEQARLKIVSPHFIDKEGARLNA